MKRLWDTTTAAMMVVGGSVHAIGFVAACVLDEVPGVEWYVWCVSIGALVFFLGMLGRKSAP